MSGTIAEFAGEHEPDPGSQMRKTYRRLIVIVLLIAAAVAGLWLLRCNCPQSGIAFTNDRVELHRLKNRTTLPQPGDFDNRITAQALLAGGQDTARWSNARAARIEAFVVSVAYARPEAANCFVGRDTHIHVALRPDAPPREHLVLELSPRMRALASARGLDWSTTTLEKTLVGRFVSFEGWLLFDHQHAAESENLNPGAPQNWRQTAWEIHPVTRIEVLR